MITDSLDKGLRDVICEIANDDNVVLSNKIHDLIFLISVMIKNMEIMQQAVH